MTKTEIIEKMMNFGLTRQEATIYGCLLQNAEITGYEVAKQTGISRSNVYNALAGLIEKGAAYLCEGMSSKYVPVPIGEFCDNKLRELGEDKRYLIENVKRTEEQTEGYITIRGIKHITNKIYQCLQMAEFRIYFYGPARWILRWEEQILELIQKGIKVVLMSDQRLEIPGCIVYEVVEPMRQQIRLIIDSRYVLTGMVTDSEEDTCLYSGQETFVNVLKDALRNEIKLIELTAQTKSDRA